MWGDGRRQIGKRDRERFFRLRSFYLLSEAQEYLPKLSSQSKKFFPLGKFLLSSCSEISLCIVPVKSVSALHFHKICILLLRQHTSVPMLSFHPVVQETSISIRA